MDSILRFVQIDEPNFVALADRVVLAFRNCQSIGEAIRSLGPFDNSSFVMGYLAGRLVEQHEMKQRHPQKTITDGAVIY